MIEGVSERIDAPTDRTGLRVGCSTVVIFCCWFGGDHANATPELSRRLTRRLTERTGEVGLARKFEGQRNIDQRPVPLPEQLFGEFKPLRADAQGLQTGRLPRCCGGVWTLASKPAGDPGDHVRCNAPSPLAQQHIVPVRWLKPVRGTV